MAFDETTIVVKAVAITRYYGQIANDDHDEREMKLAVEAEYHVIDLEQT